MAKAREQDGDPLGWCIAIAAAFVAVGLNRLTIPAKPFFDEVHYVPAARDLLGLIPSNREHPLFAKEILAASINLLGDRPLGWRLPSLLFGTMGLFAFGRLIWWAGQRRFATIAGMILLATNFTWFIQSRIAMLDIFAASLALVSLWLFTAAVQKYGATLRWRFALSGAAMGLAIASKWSAVPLAIAPGMAFVMLKYATRARNRRVAAMSLVEAGVWLGLLPLVLYWATYLPAFHYPQDPAGWTAFIEQHQRMISLQDSVTRPHPYQSGWTQWMLNLRPIWYLYEYIDEAQRGVLYLGNPATMLAGLPALLWCMWAGWQRRRKHLLAFAALYGVSLSLWLVSPKPVQFYYHYLIPSMFLMGGLAFALDALRAGGGNPRRLAYAVMIASCGMFAWFYPIMSAAVLAEGAPAFAKWMWLDSWR